MPSAKDELLEDWEVGRPHAQNQNPASGQIHQDGQGVLDRRVESVDSSLTSGAGTPQMIKETEQEISSDPISKPFHGGSESEEAGGLHDGDLMCGAHVLEGCPPMRPSYWPETRVALRASPSFKLCQRRGRMSLHAQLSTVHARRYRPPWTPSVQTYPQSIQGDARLGLVDNQSVQDVHITAGRAELMSAKCHLRQGGERIFTCKTICIISELSTSITQARLASPSSSRTIFQAITWTPHIKRRALRAESSSPANSRTLAVQKALIHLSIRYTFTSKYATKEGRQGWRLLPEQHRYQTRPPLTTRGELKRLVSNVKADLSNLIPRSGKRNIELKGTSMRGRACK
ncbi:hypothetical protein BOTBODRAFT_45206 [Botryobasidium botryosum FD-172 SS1]|uniref:Uncharacterized protein n=1 Tax=Botryobasidium botryosum (strain FD-172 SS1) TaxID=930990 RepID=A0A067MPM0_BOTB1|nr:hypothetical protein BOTBODRAFT_45206 [Botryobasidium botryosum FD-172 SS1]